MATPAIPAEPSSLVITVSADLALRQQRGAHTPALTPCDGLVMGWAIASVAPPGRQPRSAAALVRLRHSGFASLPAYRVGAGALALPAALLAALARLARPAPSPLALAKERAAGPGPTSYGLGWGPGDPPRRAILAPLSPPWRRPVGQRLWHPGQRGKAREALTVLAGHAR
jgi:hypothetical protein